MPRKSAPKLSIKSELPKSKLGILFWPNTSSIDWFRLVWSTASTTATLLFSVLANLVVISPMVPFCLLVTIARELDSDEVLTEFDI